ncbi:hypothetical protein TWF703_007509 [Orbilia oligospora]|uniref:Uncharacterized protein n=1 Tax=Orbilia oligospora TaxID=2813651 RepID=A0A7C8JQ07_ORBOL|nr:hypothetical protein TWF703_007509 [Orbilia oligospora]
MTIQQTKSRSRSLSRAQTWTPKSHQEYTLGWICALPKEQTAAKAMLDQIHPDLPKPANDDNTYSLGSIGEHNVVIACLPKDTVGTNEAAIVAAQMLNTFPSIKIGLMVGIGGGVPPNIRLGDVVVGVQVIQWDFGKAAVDGRFERTSAIQRPPRALRTAVSRLETEHDLHGVKIPRYLKEIRKRLPNLAPKFGWSEALTDPLFGSSDGTIDRYQSQGVEVTNTSAIGWLNLMPKYTWIDYLKGFQTLSLSNWTNPVNTNNKYLTTIPRNPGDVKVHYGLIASGNQVIKDAKLRDNINQSLGGKVLCVEMEAAGLMSFPYIVIRGICDYADSRKNDDWQEYAAMVAGACAKELLEYVQPSEVDKERPIRDILSQVHDDIGAVRAILNKKENIEILNWLTPIDYGPQQGDIFRSRQSGTGQWLFESIEYKSWLKSKQVLFCPGIPGAGKTVLTSIVIDDLITRFPSTSSSIGIAYIYCSFKRNHEQKLDDLLASLLKQLSQNKTSLPQTIKELYQRHLGNRTRPSREDVIEALRSVIDSYSRVFIIIDALDELPESNGRAAFISELFYLHDNYNTNILATSRFIPQLTEKFQSYTTFEIHAHDEDVRKYLDNQISQSEKKLLQNHREYIITEITKAVRGMFLLAKLHFESIRYKTTLKRIKTALETLPIGETAYASAYETTLGRIKTNDSDPEKIANQALWWIVCAKRPLTTSELQHALAVEIGEPSLDEENLPEIQDIISLCAGLVTVDEESDIVRLVHYTAQEYLERTWEKWFPNAHVDITERCITYLSYDIFKTRIPEEEEEEEEEEDQEEEEKEDSSMTSPDLGSRILYDYALQNWVYHATTSSIEITPLVLDFLKSEAGVSAYSQTLSTLQGYIDYGQWPPKRVTGVHLATYFGLPKSVEELLKTNNTDLEAQDDNGRTPLALAAWWGHNEVIDLLLDKGANLETKDDDDQTPLLQSVIQGSDEVVKLLLGRGADMECKDGFGRTPLLWAAWRGYEKITRLLLEEGADVEAQDNDGRTPLSWAVWWGNEKAINLLLQCGAYLEIKDYDGQTPLLWAAMKGHDRTIKLLLECGADLNAKDESGRTSLSWALWWEDEKMIELLIDKGADMEVRDKFNQTPLLWAAMKGHSGIAKLLLDKGADLEAKDNDNRTPSALARHWGHEDVVKLLMV